MSYLVDTHTFLWVVLSPQKISKKVKNILLDPKASKYVSVITFWEISLKFSLGKLDLNGALPDGMPPVAKDAGLEILELDTDTVASFYKFPNTRKDPFDCMLAWQAIRNRYLLLTKDSEFAEYKKTGLETVW